GTKSADDAWEDLQGAVDLVVGRVAGEAEADCAVRDPRVDLHRPQHVRRLEAPAAAGGTGAGADAVFAQQKEDRFGFESRETDVRRVGKPGTGAIDVGVLNRLEDRSFETVA